MNKLINDKKGYDYHGRNAEHERADHLLGIVGSAHIGKTDAGADQRNPRAPFQLKNLFINTRNIAHISIYPRT